MNKQWIGCAGANFRSGRAPGFKPEAVVIHIMDGTLTGTDSWFNNPQAQVSAHYGIGRGGEVHQYVDEKDTAFHAGTVLNPSWPLIKPGANPNHYTIGIEHEGRAGDPWEELKCAASGVLIAEIADRWNIPLDKLHVIPHHAIRASKPCPGDQADLNNLIVRAQGHAVVLSPPAVSMVKTTISANLREQPTTSARVVKVLVPGQEVLVAGFTDAGARVRDNSFWYRDTGGLFLWAGATDVPHPV